MRSLSEWKEIRRITKNSLINNGESFGELSIAYDDQFVDFMMSSTGSEVFIRVTNNKNEDIISLLCDADASRERLQNFNKLLNCKNVLKDKYNFDSIVESNDDYLSIVAYQQKFPDEEKLANKISYIFTNIWPYINGTKVLYEEKNTTVIDEKNDEQEVITDVDQSLKEKENETVEKQEVESETQAFEENGNVYIKDYLPKRVNRIRLITQRPERNSLQLFFLLPDEEEHSIVIKTFDSFGQLDELPVRCKNQFRYFIYPQTPDSKIHISISIDGTKGYSRTIRIPNYLRYLKKQEKPDQQKFSAQAPQVNEESNLNEQEIKNDEVKNNYEIDIDIDLSEISKEAIKLIKGE